MDGCIGYLFGLLVSWFRTALSWVIARRVMVRKPRRTQFAATSWWKSEITRGWFWLFDRLFGWLLGGCFGLV
jgi:hypothetical protein